jgi:hypothetical protein
VITLSIYFFNIEILLTIEQIIQGTSHPNDYGYFERLKMPRMAFYGSNEMIVFDCFFVIITHYTDVLSKRETFQLINYIRIICYIRIEQMEALLFKIKNVAVLMDLNFQYCLLRRQIIELSIIVIG